MPITGNKSLPINVSSVQVHKNISSYNKLFSRTQNCTHSNIIPILSLKDTLSSWYVPYYCMIYDSNTFSELVIYNNLFIPRLH